MLALLLRLIYVVVGYLLTPVFLLYLLWRSLGNADYRRRIGERFGFFPQSELKDAIWVHAVSVGEVQAAAGLIRVLLADYPERSVVVTTITPTGSDQVRALFGDSVAHSYAPLDLARPVKIFFNRVQPTALIVLETELWPNLYHECGKRNVPLVLASARVSSQSLNWYRRVVTLFKDTLSNGVVIAAQTQTDAERFVAIGASAERTHVTGNVKFDFALPDGVKDLGRAFREAHAADRPVWIAASTHADEEEAAIAAHRKVCERIPDALLIIVPRHPERFAGVAQLLERAGITFVKRSDGQTCSADCQVLLGDTMGELMTFYAGSDVAFVGGSLAKIGGHNLLEPAALELPILTGPHTYNAADIAELFQASGVAQVVHNADGLAGATITLLEDSAKRQQLGAAGKQLIGANRGALDRLVALLEPLLLQD